MMPTKSTKKGGRPPLHGGSAKPRIKGPDGKMYRDTVENRRRFGMAVDGVMAAAPASPTGSKTIPEGQTTAPVGSGRIEAPIASNENAIREELSGNSPVTVAGKTEEITPTPINYAQVLAIVNVLIKNRFPGKEMLPMEQESIGMSLDAVIAKHFPFLKDAGPEMALTVAVLSYVLRVFLPKS